LADAFNDLVQPLLAGGQKCKEEARSQK